MESHKYIRCKRCNRKLKSIDAQERGYGKICWEKHLRESQQVDSKLFQIEKNEVCK